MERGVSDVGEPFPNPITMAGSDAQRDERSDHCNQFVKIGHRPSWEKALRKLEVGQDTVFNPLGGLCAPMCRDAILWVAGSVSGIPVG